MRRMNNLTMRPTPAILQKTFMKPDFLLFVGHLVLLVFVMPASAGSPTTIDSSPLRDKAAFFQRDLLEKHWLDGLYVSIVPSAPSGTPLPHTVNQPGNVIHSGGLDRPISCRRGLSVCGDAGSVGAPARGRGSARPQDSARSHRQAGTAGARLRNGTRAGAGLGAKRRGLAKVAPGSGSFFRLSLAWRRECGQLQRSALWLRNLFRSSRRPVATPVDCRRRGQADDPPAGQSVPNHGCGRRSNP